MRMIVVRAIAALSTAAALALTTPAVALADEVPLGDIPTPVVDPVDPAAPVGEATVTVPAPPLLVESVSVSAVPAAVRRVRVTGRVVQWARVAGAEHYQVRCGTQRRQTARPRAVVPVRAGTACRVRAHNQAGSGPWSPVARAPR